MFRPFLEPALEHTFDNAIKPAKRSIPFMASCKLKLNKVGSSRAFHPGLKRNALCSQLSSISGVLPFSSPTSFSPCCCRRGSWCRGSSTILRTSSWIAVSLWAWIQLKFMRLNGADIIYSGDRLPAGEPAVVVANRVAWSDFYVT
ncbi:hypothetical protein TOPH_04899 [Tolypocladium ophioglossoides CBS 100239]|uniref:Uncharacterized protein n=1 Tax=Tolypocladium ophioglossoides (strain CBS 100239) TaxID=1163406 RepID=A0A0L0N8H4_TOLOC|nr:hypothetical protein TOPH_04899 [Tolypocladium ophioglossoides CBS 100239]